MSLSDLFETVWEVIEADPGPARRPVSGDEVSRATDLQPSGAERFPVCRHLDAALSAAEGSGLTRVAGQVRASADALVWSQNASYTEAKVGRYFLDNYATGMLTGPEGNLARQAPCSGFVLLGPDTIYAEHSHGPREVYLVLTPGAAWNVDGTGWSAVAAGQVIHHGPWQRHAMRTGATPLLAFAAWLDEGDRSAVTI